MNESFGWMNVLPGAALAAVAAFLAWLGLRGGELRREQTCRFVCPRERRPVECRILQNIRTGRWLGVQSCSAFVDPEDVHCEQECVVLMNAGARLPEPGRA
jgi:hypothetical protein